MIHNSSSPSPTPCNFNRHRTTGSAIIAFALAMFIGNAPADELTALDYFEQGERSFQRSDYDEAAKWYEQARQLREDDGFVTTAEWTEKRFISHGRGVKQITERKQQTAEYRPNARLETIGNWRKDQHRRNNPPVLQLSWIALRDPSKDNILDGGETATIVLDLRNVGQSMALDTRLDISLDNAADLSVVSTLSVGDLGPEASTIIEVPIAANRRVADENRGIAIRALEKEGFDSNPLDIVLRTRPHRPPQIAFSQVRIEDHNDDARIEPAEVVKVVARIANVGYGVADDVNAKVQLGDNVFLGPEAHDDFTLGQLFPGEHRDIEFSFLTNRRLNNGDLIPVDIVVNEASGQFSAQRNLGLTVYAPDTPTWRVTAKPGMLIGAGSPSSLEVDVDTQIPKVDIKNEHAVAVVIGNRNYLAPGLPQVDYALNDARIVKEYLINTLGYQEHNIIYLEDATAARFNETFGSERHFAGRVYSYVKPNISDVFIYYSGHGAPDINNKNAYFVPIDVDPNYIATSGYSLETFYNNLSQLPARSITVVLDTCFSGNSHGGFLLSNISPALIKVRAHQPLLERTAIFTSASPDQVSTWYHDKRHGLFTYYFLKGLAGSADINNDNLVHTGELGAYLKREVPLKARRFNGLEQTPALSQETDIMLVDYRMGDEIAPLVMTE